MPAFVDEKNVKADEVAGFLPSRPRPASLHAEKAVLAAMLREPDSCIDEVEEKFHEGAQVFYHPAHRVIYNAILDTRKNGLQVDVITVAQYLRSQQQLDAIGGLEYLADLDNAISSTANLESWCKLLLSYYTLRKLIDICASSLVKCYNADLDVPQLVDDIESEVLKVHAIEQSSAIKPMWELVENETRRIMDILGNKVETGVPTGFQMLDEFTGGFKPGEMFVIAARPSIGKTSLALNMIADLAINRAKTRTVAFFSLEMTAEQIVRRLICTDSGIAESRFRCGITTAEQSRLFNSADRVSKSRIFIDPTAGISLAELRAKVRRLKHDENIEVVFIDYLQLMGVDSRIDSRQQQVSEISGGLKKLAKDLGIPIVVLAQLNREVDKMASPNARPKLAHLRESGSIEQDADIVAFLHRDRDASKGDVESTPAELIVEKNRNGRTGIIPLLFFPSRMEFKAAAPVDISNDPS